MKRNKKSLLRAVVANPSGEIFDLEGYAAVGMAGASLDPLSVEESLPLPHGSELMYLPDRRPVLYNLSTKRLEVMDRNPFRPDEALLPVAVFNSPGYLLVYNSAFEESPRARTLPLFSYGAAGWHRGGFRTAAIRIDRERRQDLRCMPSEKVAAGARRLEKKLPQNRLRQHLEVCALTYGCPAAKNFFIGRYEAPLPASRQCNARCIGCISLQQDTRLSSCQKRIAFTPTADEITEIALAHIHRVKNAIVSFGQGCEGDPLLAAAVIEPAISKIRSATDRGTINMNTNGSRPAVLNRLFCTGLDSVRISLNSVREACYNRYFRPQKYAFSDVVQSIDLAAEKRKFVSINYLNCPGFTDSPEELEALISFLTAHRVDLIQWRNLNFDPVRYRKIMAAAAVQSRPVGMQNLLEQIRRAFPTVKFGYFNPPKEAFMPMRAPRHAVP